ncbi:hypothetical protein [uncultured Duncaniella sp.]|jgi:hypothetical protein|uniref:hypothetical protein n=1 Tax=uncultured Duncaniella sp. TaxID=2768039 RepID=UPI000F4911EC|nr:hypothetical protein [uncultured Duncaniella sp.]ROT16608.1 hypothetical protein EEL50_01965 [Muribaculaceae bacterium Isolate-105 (HZI)]
MRIEIPENIDTFGDGATCRHTLCFIQRGLLIAQRAIKDIFHETYPIDNITAFELGAYSKIITNLNSFETLCLLGEDYNSCCTLARSIADSICGLKLIYQNRDGNEIIFRHLLYILDGISERHRLLPEQISNNGRITEQEHTELIRQCNEARKNCEDVIEFCHKHLALHEYASKYPKFSKEAIKRKAWKYKCIDSSPKPKIELYSWREMYELLDPRDSIVSMYSSYFSQFVHGLAVSNLPCINDDDNIDSIASVGVCLQGQVNNRIQDLIGKDKIRSYANNEDLKYLLSLYSSDKRSKLMEDAMKIISSDQHRSV